MWSDCVTLLLIHSPAIGNAFAVLSNPEKRLRYDEFGSDREHVSTGQARHYNYYTEFEADITPEEIFNVFFGGHFPTGQYLSAVFLKCSALTLELKGSSSFSWYCSGSGLYIWKEQRLFLHLLFSPILACYAWKSSLNARFKLQILATPFPQKCCQSPALLSRIAHRRESCRWGNGCCCRGKFLTSQPLLKISDGTCQG